MHERGEFYFNSMLDYDALTFLSLLALQVPPPGVQPGAVLRVLLGEEPGREEAGG
jgi:hypothetical protein